MKNVLTFIDDEFLTLENIDSGQDSILIRYYIEDPVAPVLRVDGTDVTLTAYGTWAGMYEAVLPLSGVTRLNNTIHFGLVNDGIAYQQYTLAFYDFDENGDFHYNLWQKRLQVFQTGNALVFHAYIIALIESAATTVGAGLKTNDYGEMMVNTGGGITFDSSNKVAVDAGAGLLVDPITNKIKTVEASHSVSGIVVTESNNKVTNVVINYDDSTSHSYACTYDASGNLISFGGVPITGWT